MTSAEGTRRRKRHLTHEIVGLPLLKDTNYGMKVSWDALDDQDVDLDLQALIVDKHGFIVDVVYYNNPVALEGAVSSTGDMREGPSIQETIWVRLSKTPKVVKLIIFVLAAYNGTSLKDAKHGRLNVYEGNLIKKVASMRVENTVADADMIAAFKRQDDESWELMEIDEVAESGSHFLDILEPTIGDFIRKHIPGAPFQNVSFEMDKGATVQLQDIHILKRLSIGMGGEVIDNLDAAVDIDIVAVFFAEDGRLLGGVDHESESLFGVTHSGGYHYEHHEHFDEALSVDLKQIPDEVKSIFLLLNISSAEGTFELLRNVYVRVSDQSANSLVRWVVPAGHKESNLVVARVFRLDTALTKRWSFQAVGHFFSHHGTSWKSERAQYEMLRLLHHASPKKVPEPVFASVPSAHKSVPEPVPADVKAKASVPSMRRSVCSTIRPEAPSPKEAPSVAPAAAVTLSYVEDPLLGAANSTVTLRKKGNFRLSASSTSVSSATTKRQSASMANDPDVVPVELGIFEEAPESGRRVCGGCFIGRCA
mmetsp:Transcript_146238/g.280461  ORF Transcript_146238/g.280461 Transcript_146238/m.280461 type:complete len:536 (-) Transcript_146238:116-1723(-)